MTKAKKLIKVRDKKLRFKTWGEWDEYCIGKDIQFCNIKVDEKISDEEYCKRYKALSVNIRTGKMINYLP